MAGRAHGDSTRTPTERPGARPLVRLGVVGALLAGTAACSSSPAYPIRLGERPGDGSVMAVQPQYPVSASDAAQNARDRASQQGNYPAYGAPPYQPVGPSPAANAAPGAAADPADDMSGDAPRAAPSSGVETSDLPPPGAAPAAGATDPYGAPAASAGASRPAADPYGTPPPSSAAGDTLPADAPPPPPPQTDTPQGYAPQGYAPQGYAPQPQDIAYRFGGGTIVFGTDSVSPPALDLAAYRHRKRAAETTQTSDADQPASKTGRHRRGHAKTTNAPADTDDTASASPAAADTPFQTTVKPGESLAEVAERNHTTKAALAELNGLKSTRRVRAGRVLKLPYRYSYEVQKGDTLYTIAHRFDQDPQALAKLNGLKATPTLQPGQALTLPSDAADQGKREHAEAAGPAPEAAPPRLADAALKKAERKSRRARRAEAASETAAAEPASDGASTVGARTARGSRRRSSAPVETASAAIPSVASSTDETTGPRIAPSQTARMTPPALEPPLHAPSPTVATSAPAYRSPAFAPRAAASPVVIPPAAGSSPVGASLPGAPATGSSYAAQAAGNLYAFRAASSPRSTAAPASTLGRAAPVPTTRAVQNPVATASGVGGAKVASLTRPSYPTGYATGAAGGYGSAGTYTPSLGRARPATAPALSGGALTASDIAAAGRGRFVWPVRGKVLSGFGDKPDGRHNDGVDISAPPGTSVRAAAGGEVVYAGSSIPGFGNLVLVKHPGGWVTAYAHLDRIEVRMRDTVAQGQEIGVAGSTGGVDQPQLHFEVRYAADPTEKARPVDPVLVLPAAAG